MWFIDEYIHKNGETRKAYLACGICEIGAVKGIRCGDGDYLNQCEECGSIEQETIHRDCETEEIVNV